MPTVKVAKQHIESFQTFFMVSGAIWAAVCGVIIKFAEDVSTRQIGSFLAFCVLVVVLIWRVTKGPPFHCLDCSGAVEAPLETVGEGVPLLSLCKHCDVLWVVDYSPTRD